MAEAQEILRLVKSGNFQMTEHAYGRSVARHITRAQIIHCAGHCIRHTWQKEKKTHLFIGQLDATNMGGFCAVLRVGAVIVTVFRRRLSKWEKKRKERKVRR